MKALIFDTETTSVNEPEIIEAAWIELTDPFDKGLTTSERFKPTKEITIGGNGDAPHHNGRPCRDARRVQASNSRPVTF